MLTKAYNTNSEINIIPTSGYNRGYNRMFAKTGRERSVSFQT